MELYKISRGASCKAAKWKPIDISWPDFLNRLNSPARTGETVAEYKRMSKAEKSAAKDVGGFVAGELANGKRSNRTVRNRSMVTLDADKAYPGQWDDVTLLCEYCMAMYSTHSHTPEEPRLRFIFPLSRTVSPDEYGAVSRKLAQIVGIETMDRTTYEPARLMYWPSCPADGEYLFRHQSGPVVDVDEILNSYGPDDAWRDTSLWPCSTDEAEVVNRELKELGDPREKSGLVGAFCRAYDVEEAIAEFIPDIYEPCDTHSREPRYTYTGGSTFGGVSIYNDGLYLFSRHDTDPAGGGIHCQNAFDVVRIHKFNHLDKGNLSPDPTRRPSYKAMCEWVHKLDSIKQLLAAEKMAAANNDFSDMGGIAIVEPEDGVEGEMPFADALNGSVVNLDDYRDYDPLLDDEPPQGFTEAQKPVNTDWTKGLTYKPKSDELDATAANVLLILENDPNLKDTFATNEIYERTVIFKPLPWRKKIHDKVNGDPWTDSDSAALRIYMEQVWGLKNRNDIQDCIIHLSEKNKRDPLREYLEKLEWDGKERLDSLLVRYMGARDTEYVRAVTRKWFTAAVARTFEPGRKFDTMLVLIGKQGLGKSTLCQMMSRGYFTDSITDMKGKDAYSQLRAAWLVEIAELAGMKRADVEVIKNFISKTEDTYRPAYREYERTFKRRCVFFGTTNDPEFLRDRTGNRRFWPVEVKGCGEIGKEGVLNGLKAEIDQLWAEAVVRYRKGEALWLDDPELRAAAEAEQARFTVQDELAGQIADYLDMELPNSWDSLSPEDRAAYIQGRSPLDLGTCELRRDVVSITEIRCELCGEERTKGGGNDLLSRRIANLMNTMPGWEKLPKRRRIKGYGQQWVYQRIAE